VRAIDIRHLTAGYGGVPAVHGLSMHVDEGEIVVLLGSNGAGKSTTLLTVAGVLPVLDGDIDVLGQPVRGASAHAVARRGLALLSEDRGIFFQLTASENLRLHRHRGSSITLEQVLDYFPTLELLLDRKAGLLSGGEQQMLALGCKLIAQPRALMIDEMSLGLAPIVVQRLLPVVQQIARDTGVAVLIVEQHVHAAVGIADRGYVLARGQLVFSATAEELRQQRGLLEASYMGPSAAAGLIGARADRC
jgi:branched-chain amino acid transport system ATP-binding protein